MSAAQQQSRGAPRMGADQDQLAATVVLELHRLVKQASLYTSENEAQRQQLHAAQQAIYQYGRGTGANPKIYFTERSVYVGRRLLRAGRQIYEAALELAEILKRFGIDEIALGYDVQVDELKQLQVALGNAIRNAGPPPQQTRFARIRLRKGRSLKQRRASDKDLSPQEVLVRSYCLAVIAVRRFLESIQAGKYDQLNQLQRVAEQLVDITHEMTAKQSPAFLAGVVLYNVRHESAGRAVNAAMLALSMAHQLTDQLATLSRIAMSVLMYDVGLPRVAGAGPMGEGRVGAMMPRIGVDQERELPAATSVVMLALGGCGEAAMMHTAVVYEALSINLRENAMPAYCGAHQLSIEARIVAMARRFTELLADPMEERTAEQAMTVLLAAARDEADKTSARLLMAALGMFPTGTMVELSSGHVARVVQTPNDPRRFGYPMVVPVVDSSGGRVADAEPIDMEQAAQHGLHIVRVAALGDPSAGANAPARGSAEDAAKASRALKRTMMGVGQPTPITPVSRPDVVVAARSGKPGPAAPAVKTLPSPSSSPLPKAVAQQVKTSQQRTGEFVDSAMNYMHAMDPPSDHGDALAVDLPSSAGELQPFGAELPSMGEDEDIALDFGDHPPAHRGPQQSVPSDAEIEAKPKRVPPRPPPPARAPELIDTGWDAPPVVPRLATPMPHDEAAIDALVENRLEALFGSDTPIDDQGASPIFASGPEESSFDSHADGRELGAQPFDGGTDADEDGSTSIFGGASAMAGLAGFAPAPLAAAEDPWPAAPEPIVLGPADEKARALIARRQQRTVETVERSITGLKPVAQGTLAKTPLIHLLVYALDQQLTGTTVLQAPDGTSLYLIYFESGVPAKVRTSGNVFPLDYVLHEMGMCDPEQLQQSLAVIQQTGELHGAYLVAHGIVPADALEAALNWQLVRKIEYMLQLGGDTLYAFYSGRNLLDDYGGPELVPADPLALILSGVRFREGDPLIDHTLGRLGKLPLGLHPRADVSRLGLQDHERRVVDLLRERPRSLAELVEARVAPPEIVKRTIYALAITRFLNLGAQARAPVGFDVDPQSIRGGRSGAASTSIEAVHAATTAPRHPLAPSPPAAAAEPPGAARVLEPVVQESGAAAPAASAVRIAAIAPRPPSPRQPQSNPFPAVISSTPPVSPLPPSSDRRGAARAPMYDDSPSAARYRPQPQVRRVPPARVPIQASLPQRGASDPPAAAAPRAAGATTPPPRKGVTREEVEKRAAEVEEQNFFQILGVHEQTPPEAIQSVYFGQAKIWHPDRTPQELQDLKPKVARIFARINEAFQTLSDPHRRQAYSESLRAGGGKGEREMLEKAVDSAMLFQKAEVLFKRGSLAQAEGMLQQCVDADPQPEYVALLAWIQAQRLGEPPALQPGQKTDMFLGQIKMLDRAISSAPEYERALYYRAELYKRSGMFEQAIRDFKKVVALNPRNIDAAREVRFFEMRNQKQGGILGKLFKKE
jgi:hypothetical protein